MNKDIFELLEYPIDCNFILQNKKKLKRILLENNTNFIEKNVAIIGGSTTSEIKAILDLFLLHFGIKANFYEGGYNQYFTDIMFENKELEAFKPDIIYIHTSSRNILEYPEVSDNKKNIQEKLENEFEKYKSIWEKIRSVYNCIIIQNNFEMLPYRILGNADSYDDRGMNNFILRLNQLLSDYCQMTDNFYISDLNYISANYGLEKWHNFKDWHLYKYCCSIEAIPLLSFNIARIIKSIFGKNKKTIVVDLDNTLWGGIIGECSPEELEIGEDSSIGAAYSEFQKYLKKYKDLGILLCINSKNEYNTVIKGLQNPNMTLSSEDFVSIKANWDNKLNNIYAIEKELNLPLSSFVFIDDNKFERNLISSNTDNISVPDISDIENYIKEIDKYGYFEKTIFSEEDLKRTEIYKENVERTKYELDFEDYNTYLKSLEMEVLISNFDETKISRITQLINKTNQFNLTGKRLSLSDIKCLIQNKNNVHLYGQLKDKFGESGLVTAIAGSIDKDTLNIDIWVMSCRVFKRTLEDSMLNELVKVCREKNIKKIIGHYIETNKNSLVKDFYNTMGFKLIESKDKESTWELNIKDYQDKESNITVRN